jgi:hypothetical protein
MNQYLFELLPGKHCILHIDDIDDDKIDLPTARCLGNLEQIKEEQFPVSMIASLKETLISFTLTHRIHGAGIYANIKGVY